MLRPKVCAVCTNAEKCHRMSKLVSSFLQIEIRSVAIAAAITIATINGTVVAAHKYLLVTLQHNSRVLKYAL